MNTKLSKFELFKVKLKGKLKGLTMTKKEKVRLRKARKAERDKRLQEKYGKTAVMITGKTDPNDRGEIVRKFQEDDSVKVFLGGYKSAGAGITLTAASNTMFMGYPWNPADLEQASNRNHRPGTKATSVNIYQLFVAGTVDAYQKEMLSKKQKIFDAVIDGNEVAMKDNAVDCLTNKLLNKHKLDK